MNNWPGSLNDSNATPKVGLILGIWPTIPDGVWIWPVIIPTIAVIIIPINIEPGTFLAYKITVIIIPNIANNTGALVKWPSVTSVESFLIMIPELWSPTKVINNPIPAETAIFIW